MLSVQSGCPYNACTSTVVGRDLDIPSAQHYVLKSSFLRSHSFLPQSLNVPTDFQGLKQCLLHAVRVITPAPSVPSSTCIPSCIHSVIGSIPAAWAFVLTCHSLNLHLNINLTSILTSLQWHLSRPAVHLLPFTCRNIPSIWLPATLTTQNNC